MMEVTLNENVAWMLGYFDSACSNFFFQFFWIAYLVNISDAVKHKICICITSGLLQSFEWNKIKGGPKTVF